MAHISYRTRFLFLSIVFCILYTMTASAQLNYEFTEGKYMIKGQVADLQSNMSVPNANIWVTNQHKGVSAEGDGKFTMYVYATDTLRFSAIGYITKTIPVTAIPEREKYTFILQLVPDIYSLKAVTIYPFHNKEEFVDQFIKGKGVSQPILIAGIAPPKYQHKEKTKFYNPISAIYNGLQKKKQAADPDFKP